MKGESMYKEFIIIVIILIFVFGIDFFTNNYVKDSVSIMTDKLETLKETILQEDTDDIEEKLAEIKIIWEEKYNVLSYYIEHDELEKVGIQIALLNGDLQVEEYNTAIENLEEVIYILKHIQEKEQFDFRSIF